MPLFLPLSNGEERNHCEETNQRSRRREKLSTAAVVTLAALLAVIPTTTAHAEHIPFLFISDVHLDMWYGTSKAYGTCNSSAYNAMGTSGCDSPKKLLHSLIDDISHHHPNTRVIYAGDWLRHDMNLLPIDDAYSSMKYAAAQIAKIPHSGLLPAPTPFAFPALGNNDFVPDYVFDVLNTFNRSVLSNMTAALVENKLLNETESQTFAQCAYFTRLLPGLPLRVIVLNTLVYSVNLKPPIDPTIVTDPCDQFAFLQAQLENVSQMNAAADKGSTPVKAIIVAHIPPMLNLFSILGDDSDNATEIAQNQYIHQEYQDTLQNIFQNYSSVISMHFYGHTHQLSYLADPALGAPGVIVPAITPLDGNRPAYLIGHYDTEAGTFSNFTMRSIVIPSSSTYSSQTLTSLVEDTGSNESPYWVDIPVLVDSLIPFNQGVAAMKGPVLAMATNNNVANLTSVMSTSTSTKTVASIRTSGSGATTTTTTTAAKTKEGKVPSSSSTISAWDLWITFYGGGQSPTNTNMFPSGIEYSNCTSNSACRSRAICGMLGSSSSAFVKCMDTYFGYSGGSGRGSDSGTGGLSKLAIGMIVLGCGFFAVSLGAAVVVTKLRGRRDDPLAQLQHGDGEAEEEEEEGEAMNRLTIPDAEKANSDGAK